MFRKLGLPGIHIIKRHTQSAMNTMSNQKGSLPTVNTSSQLLLQKISTQFPTAKIECKPSFLFSNRKQTSINPSTFFTGILSLAKPLFPTIGVFDFSDLNLRTHNIIHPKLPEICKTKYYDMLGDLHSKDKTMTEEEKTKSIFEPYRKSSGPIIHIDHHYPDKSLSRTSTTPLLLDFVLYCHSVNDFKKIDALKKAFVIMDHADPDIVLAHFVSRNANRKDFLSTHENLIKSTALYNDYAVITGNAPDETKRFFYLLDSFQHDIDQNRMTMAQALDLVEPAIQFTTSGIIFSDSSEITNSIITDFTLRLTEAELKYTLEKNTLESYIKNLKINPFLIESGSCSIQGNVFILRLSPQDPYIDNATVSEYLQERHSNLLETISVICTISNHDGYYVKLRSIPDSFGQLMDLNIVFTGLKEINFQKYKQAGGRSLAGSLSKSPISSNDPSWATKTIRDIVNTVTTVRVNSGFA